MNNQQNRWVKVALLSTLWVIPYPLLAQSEFCADVLTYGQNPQTGKWQTFPTPCDVPSGWQTSPEAPEESSVRADPPPSTTEPPVCEQVITYGRNPQTGVWVEYPTPCDVPQGWETSPTKPDTGGSSIQPDSTTTSPGETGGASETGDSGDNTTSSNSKDCAKEEITYAQHPTLEKWYIFSNPCEVPTGWKSSQTADVCAAIIVFGQSPNTGTWYPFATPCDVLASWPLARIKPEKDGPPKEGLICPDTTEYAQNPKTTNAYQFNNACDIPEGWTRLDDKPFKLMPEGDVNCPPVITYAQPAEKKNWYAFSSVCEVPQGWIKSATPPKSTPEEDCSSFKVTYSSQDGKVHIPFVFLNHTDTQPAFKEAELELLVTPLFSPYLFFLNKVTVPEPVEDSQP